MIPTLAGVILFVFFLFKFFGGDPAEILGGLLATPEQIQAIRQQLGLNDPWWVQLWIFVKSIFSFKWGNSWATGEAVSNIIKHSGASRCTVRCTIAEGDFQVVIQDNGKGIPMELDGRLDRGHGMASMKHRAKQLQGQCLVESGPGYGTVIRLTIPLDRHLASA